jgi:hypothetical protein
VDALAFDPDLTKETASAANNTAMETTKAPNLARLMFCPSSIATTPSLLTELPYGMLSEAEF